MMISKFVRLILTAFFLSNLFAYSIEKVPVDILDPIHEKFVQGYFVKLQKGELLYERKLDNLIGKLLACPAALRLVNKALQDGSIIVFYGKSSEVPAGGLWNPQLRLIKISDTESEARQLGHLLYEFADALQYNNQIAFSEAVESGAVGREKYTENWERIQYSTAKEFVAAVDQCIELNKWPQAASMGLGNLFIGGKNAIGATFERFWSHIKNQPHADFFRNDWDRIAKKKYCKNNPKAEECQIGFLSSLKKIVS